MSDAVSAQNLAPGDVTIASHLEVIQEAMARGREEEDHNRKNDKQDEEGDDSRDKHEQDAEGAGGQDDDGDDSEEEDREDDHGRESEEDDREDDSGDDSEEEEGEDDDEYDSEVSLDSCLAIANSYKVEGNDKFKNQVACLPC